MAMSPAIHSSNPVVRFDDVSKTYRSPAGPFGALKHVNLEIKQGECVAVVGPSGSGKTTLVNLLAGIDKPSTGHVRVGDCDIGVLEEDAIASFRGRNIGLVFQFFQLLPTLTVLENVVLPMDFCGTFRGSQRRDRGLRLLAALGIADQSAKLPQDLSGGQQQRAAIARALANDPSLIVADEPTGNLDSQTAQEVMRFLAELANQGKTVLVVTHERDLSRFFTRVIRLRDGIVTSESHGADRQC